MTWLNKKYTVILPFRTEYEFHTGLPNPEIKKMYHLLPDTSGSAVYLTQFINPDTIFNNLFKGIVSQDYLNTLVKQYNGWLISHDPFLGEVLCRISDEYKKCDTFSLTFELNIFIKDDDD